MRHRLCIPTIAALWLMLVWAPPGSAQEGADHPLVGRFEDSQIVDYERTDFDEYVLLTREVTSGADWDDPRKAGFGSTLEGTVTRITYESPSERTTLEVMRAYEEALQNNGFEVLFECQNAACGGRNFNHAVVPYGMSFAENYQDQRYLAALQRRPAEGDVHVAIYTVKATSIGGARRNRVYTQVDVVEQATRTTRVVVIPADELAERISTDGKVALYGIYFDTDSATLRSDSAPTLEQIGELLRGNPEMKLLVVGHTDSQGGFDYNIDLSQRRAAAVAEALVSDYGVERGRLRPWGVGYTAPVASNATDEGRGSNRRVELVAD